MSGPYIAAFAARFLQMLQYRAAALAGFATQVWWGAIKVMVFAAFFATSAAANAPMTLAQAITYVWLGQGLLVLLPWGGDPDVALAARSGALGLDRVRPVDTYWLWYARGAGWLLARMAPRLALMVLSAGVLLPLAGLDEWALGPPQSATAFVLFLLSITLAALLSTAILMIINGVIAATLSDRGANTLFTAIVTILSGNLIPLALFPDSLATVLILQPFAGLQDIPFRIYFGALSGAEAAGAIGVQAFWVVAIIVLGRAQLAHVMQRLEVQGG